MIRDFRVKGILSKVNLNKVLKGPMKKHLTYLWCELNGVTPLRLRGDHRRFLVHRICKEPIINSNRKNYHDIIRKIISENPELEYIKPYLRPAHNGPQKRRNH